MSSKACTIRTRKFLTNRLLSRRQFVSTPEYASFASKMNYYSLYKLLTCRSSMCFTPAGPMCPRQVRIDLYLAPFALRLLFTVLPVNLIAG